jgi:hypothetical protein
MPIVAFTQEYSRVSNPQGTLLDLVGVTLWKDNGHKHGGTTTLKDELTVHLF